MPSSQTIRKGAKWLLFGNIGNQVFQFAFGIVLARLLFPSDFGIIVTIQVVTGIASMVASGGIGQALVRAKSASVKDFHVVFTYQLLIGLGIYIFFFTLAPWFAHFFNEPIYTTLLRVSALTFITRPFANIHSVWLHREMRFRAKSIINVIVAISNGTTSVVLALSGLGVWSLVFAGLFGVIVNISLLARRTPVSPRLCFDIQRIKSFSSYGIKVSANDVINYLQHQISNIIISKASGASLVGLYNKADSLAKLPLTAISGSIYQPLFREMAKSQDDLDKTGYLLLKTISLLALYTLPIYLGLFWMGEPFIRFIYGEKWIETAEPLQIISLIGLFFCIGQPCGAVLAAQNKVGQELILQTSTLSLTAVSTYIGLKWGLSGVAWGIVATQIYAAIAIYWLVTKAINVSFSALISILFPILFLNLIFLVTLMGMHQLLPDNLAVDHPAVYLLIQSTFAGLAYLLAFLVIPFESIAPEVLRWRKILRLAT